MVSGPGVSKRITNLIAECRPAATGKLRSNRTPKARAAWLALRQTGIGASDVAAILGIEGAYSSPFALWWAKQPGAPLPSGEMDEEQEWGLRLEDAIADKFVEGHPELYTLKPPAALYVNNGRPWQMCSPDRLTVRCDSPLLAPLELKTDQNPKRWGDWPPECYRVQLLWQCAVFGVTVGYLAALIGKRYREYRIEFGQDELDEVVGIVDAWRVSLKGEPPDVDGHDATRAAVLRLYPNADLGLRAVVPADVVAEYETADDEAKAAADRLAAAKNRMVLAMGSAGKAITEGGRVVCARRTYDHPGAVIKPYRVDAIWRAQAPAEGF